MCIAALLALLPASGLAGPYSEIFGDVRVEFLSPTLVRLERKGPRGFEDRPTFNVVNRNISFTQPKKQSDRDSIVELSTDSLIVQSSTARGGMEGVTVWSTDHKLLYRFEPKLPKNTSLPAPGSCPPVWTMIDSPRLVPPVWGATPAPPTVDPSLARKSGWDDRNDAPDVYVFVPGKGGYRQLRKDFLGLTGPVPKPPLSVLGFIDSRWFPYTEKQALESIDTYRKKRIPLDTLVVDTDWRVNGSDGYEVEKKDFPDMPRFIKEAHDRHVHLMFNDHPNPKAAGATDPAELAFRWEGLSKLLNWGMDIWWYDRNWSTSLHEPMPGIRKEVWGQHLYHDMTQKARPSERPWIMTNAQGIDNGISHYPADPSGHRYPMWWTGDTGSQFAFLKRGVENGVDRGVLDLQPYTHEDLGGHTGPTPSPELYTRYLEFGCLSPVTRVHCTLGQDRHPWAFGPEAEKITTDYIKLRYRLLPTLYSAAQQATDDGTPILRRCDLEWTTYKEAAANDQYMLGEDILVAPIVESMQGELAPIPEAMLHTPDGQIGLRAEYFDNEKLSGKPKVVKTDPQIGFDWSGTSPVPGIGQENFSVRWTGSFGPVPESGKYRILTKNDDGVRVYLDEKLIIDDWKPEDSAVNEVAVNMEAGSTHHLRVEYMQLGGGALCTLGWYKPSQGKVTASHRDLWIPPGAWQDLWTGETVLGPQTIGATAMLGQIPMYVRVGGIVLTGPDLQYTGEKPVDPITADVYLGGKVQTRRELVEDDGHSTAYLHGELARTLISLKADDSRAAVLFGSTAGSYKGMRHERNWVLHLHLPLGKKAKSVAVDGEPATATNLPHRTVVIPFLSAAAPAEGDVIEVKISKADVSKSHVVMVNLAS